MHAALAVILCVLAVCFSLMPGFVILGYYQDFVLNALPNCWLDPAQVALAAFKVIGSSLLCLLAIMLYSDLALAGVMCSFGWILSRMTHPESDGGVFPSNRRHLDQKHSKRHFSLTSPNTKEMLMQRVTSLALPSQHHQNANGNGFSKCFRHFRSGSIH